MKVFVVGDFMLDLVLPCEPAAGSSRLNFGGAGTVARGVSCLGGEPVCVGWVARDAVGDETVRLAVTDGPEDFLRVPGVGASHLRIHQPGAARNPVARLDNDLPRTCQSRVRDHVRHSLETAPHLAGSVVVVSDFARSPAPVIGPTLPSRVAWVVIGSKGSLYPSRPRSVLVTSTEDRNLIATSPAALRLACSKLARARQGWVVLTAGARGAVLSDGETETWVPAPTSAAVLEVGAGDWLLAALAMSLGHGRSLLESLEGAVLEASRSVVHVTVGGRRPDGDDHGEQLPAMAIHDYLVRMGLNGPTIATLASTDRRARQG